MTKAKLLQSQSQLSVGEKLHDNRFLRLIRHLLQSGYLEEWKFHHTMSGAPQGGVVAFF